MKAFILSAFIAAALLVPPVVSSYPVSSVWHLVGTACDGGGGGGLD